MSSPNRKVGFYSLKLKDNEEDDTYHPTKKLLDVFDYMRRKNRSARVNDIEQIRKIHLLNSFQPGRLHNSFFIVFESGRYYHRSPLIDRSSAAIRDSPKTKDEGEDEKTHMVIRNEDDGFVAALEERRNVITINGVVQYLNWASLKYYESRHEKCPYSIDVAIIPSGRFLSQLKGLKRAIQANVQVSRAILGSDYLNWSKRVDSVKESVTILVASKRGADLKRIVREFLGKMSGTKYGPERIRVKGINAEGNQVILDTEVIKRMSPGTDRCHR
jgi:hypothetical protein